MTLPTPDNAPGTPPDPAAPASTQPGGDGEQNDGLFARIRQAAIDNYNGLYVIVLKPRMPEGIVYAIGIIGLLVGLLWAYVIAPTVFVGANPNRLNESAQSQWVLMTAVGAFPDAEYANETAIELVNAVPNPRETIQTLLQNPDMTPTDRQALQNLLTLLPADAIGTPAPTAPGLLSNLLNIVLAIVVVVIITIVIVLLWRFLIYDNIVAPVLQRIEEARNPEIAERNQRARDELKIQQEQRRLREEMEKEVVTSELGDPIMRTLAIYSPGRQFDESYEIELETGEFLGQSGTVIAEAVDPDPVAVEVWLFDMFSQQNVTKVFITPQANNDPALRSRIESSVDNPTTDIIVAQPNAQITLDSDKIQLQAKLASVEVNANGRFENFKMQVLAWQKDAAGASTPAPAVPSPPTPAGAPPMSAYDDIQFDPPPAPPSNSGAPPMSAYDDIQFDPPPAPPSQQPLNPPPSFGNPPQGNQGMPPLQPPPLRQPPPPSNDDDDDDPFGGTGDFTPLPGR